MDRWPWIEAKEKEQREREEAEAKAEEERKPEEEEAARLKAEEGEGGGGVRTHHIHTAGGGGLGQSAAASLTRPEGDCPLRPRTADVPTVYTHHIYMGVLVTHNQCLIVVHAARRCVCRSRKVLESRANETLGTKWGRSGTKGRRPLRGRSLRGERLTPSRHPRRG